MKVRLFDVCVFGRGLGGLVAALMLQRRGAKVAVLSDRKTSSFEPVLCEFLNGFTLKPILKRVGFHPTEVNAIPALEAPLQLVFPDKRIDCFGEEEAFERELNREFPSRSEKILQLFKESYGHLEIYQHIFNSRTAFPPKNYMAKRKFTQMLEQISDAQLLEDRPLEEELKSFTVGEDFARAIKAMELALTSLVTPWTCGAHLAHLLTLVRWEGYASPSGPVSIRDMFLRKIKERGGHLAEFDEITELHLDRKRIQGASIKGADWDEVRCQAAIVGGDPRGLISLSPKSSKCKQWEAQLNELPVHAGKAYQIFRLTQGGIPVGMKPQGIIVPDGPPGGGVERRKVVRALRYAIRWHGENEKKPENWLGVTAFLDPEAKNIDPRKLAEEIRTTLKTIIPFLDDYLVEEPKPPFRPSVKGTPGDFRQGFVYTADSPRYLGVCGVSPETPFKNTFQASDMVFPGLGLDGEILAGLHATHWAAEYLSHTTKHLGGS